MSFPSMVQKSGNTLIVRSLISGNQLYPVTNFQSQGLTRVMTSTEDLVKTPVVVTAPGTIPPTANTKNLPQCRVRRTYTCVHCKLLTQNPRDHLYHLRDVHKERVRIFECTDCIYASKQYQKLVRHKKMVHGSTDPYNSGGGRSHRRAPQQSLPPKVNYHESSDPKTEFDNKFLVKIPDDLGEMQVDPRMSENEEQMYIEETYLNQQHFEQNETEEEFQCRLCVFKTTSKQLLEAHEREGHVKTKFFRCVKCSYLTHIKARFTKHVKYHSMPMIKCEMCDFRTPYKWNLDRHSKNHNGNGTFKCSICNFTADIKQSLTVHEMNHHVPPIGSSGLNFNRKRNKVGGSDSSGVDEILIDSLADMDYDLFDEQMPGVLIHDKRKHHQQKPEVSSKRMRADDSGLSEESDDLPQYVRNQCRFCSFKTVWDTEMIQHEMSIHCYNRAKNNVAEASKKKSTKPIPNLIPINSVKQELKTNLMMKTESNPDDDFNDDDYGCDDSNDKTSDVNGFILKPSNSTLDDDNANKTLTPAKMGNTLFFDKLQEKLLIKEEKDATTTTVTCKRCGFIASCLADIETHQISCRGENDINDDVDGSDESANELSITATRCPYCRLRFKISSDLKSHLSECPSINNSPIKKKLPSENLTFEWDTCVDKKEEFDDNQMEEIEIQPEIEIMAFEYGSNDEENESGNEIDNDNETDTSPDGNVSPNDVRNDYKQVFKCPYCEFASSIVSQFHVHFINHSDRKPFECSICQYRSVWRWDIVKHIRIKSSKDPSHDRAKVVTIDETGRRNYSKYNQYLVRVDNDNFNTNNDFDEHDYDSMNTNDNVHDDDHVVDTCTDKDENDTTIQQTYRPFGMTSASQKLSSLALKNEIENSPTILHLNDCKVNADSLKTSQRFFKCKRCGFTNSSRENMITHIQIMHNKNSTIQQVSILNNDVDDLGFTKERGQFRCAHCNQISNWKHVIQRHCRLKHNGDIKVIIINKFGVEKLETEDVVDDHTVLMENHQNASQQEGSFKCSFCQFSCDSFMEFESHFNQHSAEILTNCRSFKCTYCEVIFDDKSDLNEHLIQNHGKLNTQRDYFYECHLCDFNTNNKQHYLGHFEKCHNNNQEDDDEEDDAEEDEGVDGEEECEKENGNETETDNGMQQEDDSSGELIDDSVPNNVSFNVDEQSDKVHDLDTKHFTDIPLVWVSRRGDFVKMYKCRYCPHVNFRKININDHEKMHRYREADPSKPNDVLHYCTDCSYVCNNAGVLSSHSKVHRGFFGVIHCLVDYNKSDQEQIGELVYAIQSTNSNQKVKTNDLCFDVKLIAHEFTGDNFPKNDELPVAASDNSSTDSQLLSFCNQCPARFLCEAEVMNHKRFHLQKFVHRCICCSYTAKQKPHILAHDKVHMKDYQTKTNILLRTFRINDKFMPPKLITIMKEADNSSRLLWVVHNGDLMKLNAKPNVHKGSQCYSCSKCPAKFFKEDALNYHLNLHGKDSPYKCTSCDYAAKNVVSLERHQSLHRNFSKESEKKMVNNAANCVTDSSQEKNRFEQNRNYHLQPYQNNHQIQHFDPQFGTLINGNPNFIYPTCLKKGKLKEKRYKCHKCPSAFEKREQYRVHLTLHGSQQKYTCDYCDYSVKYYANFTQHIKKHEMHNEALAIKQLEIGRNEEQSQLQHEETEPEEELPETKEDLERPSNIADVDSNMLKHVEHISRNSTFVEIKKFHTCQYCPYSNYRKDAVDSHLKRHISVSGIRHAHVCNYCDYTVPQAHFLREHEKLHSEHFKQQMTEGANQDVDDEGQIQGHGEGSTQIQMIDQNDNDRYACSAIEEQIFEKFAEKKDISNLNFNSNSKHMEIH